MKNRSIVTLFLCFIYFFVTSQEITGIVIDSKTSEPLSGASVYFNNTTIGTISDSEGRFAIEYKKDLRTELVVSFIGYETFITGDLLYKEDLIVSLNESLNELYEIELSSNDNWSRELKLKEFKKHFLGTSSAGESCRILNEEDIELKYDFRKKKLTGKSYKPIIIENNDLKYLVSADLKFFKAEYSHVSKNKKRLSVKFVSYYGTNQFRSMQDLDTDEVEKIREIAYKGSTLHFMRALSVQNLKNEGFEIIEENGQRVQNISHQFKVSPAHNQKGVIVNMTNKAFILYNGEKRSSIECITDQFFIDDFGNHTPPASVIFTGDIGRQRMGNTLPLDYFVTESSQNTDLEFPSSIEAPNDAINSYREKIYIHFDKSNYYAGEDMWFKVYLVDAHTHKSYALSKVVYVDLISPSDKIVDTKIIKIDGGGSEGDFKLSKDLINGQYTVRAYTNFMRNFDASYFFRKKMHIISSMEIYTLKKDSVIEHPINEEKKDDILDLKPDVQFFPEGGYLVDNFINRVGFKVVGINGKGIDINGRIVDETGKKIISIRTSKFGMGNFSFTPILGKSYKAEIIYNNLEVSYDLPSTKNEGVLMHVAEYEDNYTINLQSSLPGGTKNFQVIGSKNGEVIYSTTIMEDKTQTMVNISKAALESGIVQFTVLDAKRIPLCERLVYVETKEIKPEINIASSKMKYGTRELIELEISMDQLKKKSVQANMSLSVTDVTFEQKDSLDLDIKSHLLLNSELKGTIENPGYYFYSKDSVRKENLDILMMCQGWRQFIWNEGIHDSIENIKHPIEQGFSFTGNVKKYFNHNKSEPVTVSIIIRNKEMFEIDELQTNEEGRFEFGDYDINDSTSIIIQAKSSNKKKAISKKSLENPKTNYFIQLDTFVVPEIGMKSLFSNEVYKNRTNQFLELSQPINQTDWSFEVTEEQIELEEVELTAEIGLEKYASYVKNNQLYRRPSQRLDFLELGKYMTGNIIQNLDGKIAGLTVQYVDTIGGKVIMDFVAFFKRSQSQGLRLPLYLLDGMPVDVAAINSIPMVEVLFVDALKGAKATIYGSAGGHGVIAVYTKDGSEIKSVDNKERRGIITFIHTGYSQLRKFYEPVYKTNELDQKYPDHRRTICWKPMVNLDKEGKAKISFYSADVSTTYRVVLEGISDNGIPLVSEILLDIE